MAITGDHKTELFNHLQRAMKFFIEERCIEPNTREVSEVFACLAGWSAAQTLDEKYSDAIGYIVERASVGFVEYREELKGESEDGSP